MIDVLVTVLSYVAVVLLVLIVIVMVLAYRYRHLQDMLLYHPEEPAGSRARVDGPGAYGIARYEALEIFTPDGVTLRGFLLPPSGNTTGNVGHAAARCVIIYFHGNAGNVGHRVPIARLLAERVGAIVVMVDYRGFGASDGGVYPYAPTEKGLKLDAEAVMDFCLRREDLRRLPVFVMGTSLGGAVTVHLGAQPRYDRAVAGYIVENSFTSISDMADVVFAPFLTRMYPGWRGKGLVFLLSRVIKPITLYIGWTSIDSIRQLTGPMLFLSSAKDELVPQAHMRALHDGAAKASLRRFVNFPDSTHNDAPAANGYAEHIADFVREVVSRRGHALGTV